MKTCNVCKKVKPFSEFYKNKASKDGHAYRCKPCNQKQCTEWRENNPEKIKKAWRQASKTFHYNRGHRWKQYKMTADEFKALSDKRENKCDICSQQVAMLVVDHCHLTGIVRGLLCDSCNRGLGCFKDDGRILRLASNYVNNPNDLGYKGSIQSGVEQSGSSLGS